MGIHVCYNLINKVKKKKVKNLIKNKVIVIAGPTAVGKTALSIEIARTYDGEIVNGDSQQVYQDVHIGTAKATKEEQEAIKHHLIDIRALSETFSAHDFVTAANQAIADVLARGKLPIIVGGTGLYLQSLIEGYHLGGQGNHEKMRALRQELEVMTDEELYHQVSSHGIEIAQPNRRRAIRAIELVIFGGDAENTVSDYEFIIIGLNMDRNGLYARINQRVDKMMAEGLLAEAKMLYDTLPDAQVARAIGYKEFFPYFSGQSTLEDAIELVKRNSRRYSKRQITWFKNRMAVEFLDVFAADFKAQTSQKIERFLDDSN